MFTKSNKFVSNHKLNFYILIVKLPLDDIVEFCRLTVLHFKIRLL
ncbi:unnamed protein product [Schistosoma margrebowiei]|uniref:Uncharacterized protein n=1 Tax=Schistosoma margrebowiei TaxID=48269 RepID=A0A3P7YLQ5_9TREM|nr:unnamed protein product [Schistosoma margrebowiei]